MQQNEVLRLQIALPDEGMTLKLNVTKGSVVFLGSDKIENPNEAFYNFRLSNDQPELYISRNTLTSVQNMKRRGIGKHIILYFLAQGERIINQFILDAFLGDTTGIALAKLLLVTHT